MVGTRAKEIQTGGVDRFGMIETRGIDYVPRAERHGHPRELFSIFATASISYSNIIVGGLLPMFGLSLWQSILVVLLGNLTWLHVGILACSGPSAGTPSTMITRSMYGVHGNKINVAWTSWAICLAAQAVWLIFAVQTVLALFALFSVPTPPMAQFLILCAIALLTLTISVYGHATIARLSGLCATVLAVGLVPLVASLAPHITMPLEAASTPFSPVAFSTALVLIASQGISWCNSADYARYLPAETSRSAIIFWTALGGAVPAVLLQIFGVLASSAIDMTNFQLALAAVLPAWFYPVFLLLFLTGTVCGSALVAYASGLALQAMGVKIRRARSVVVDGLVAVAITCYALFVSDLTSTITSVLEMIVVPLAPGMAIYLTDMALRRNRYDGPGLNDDTPAGPIWYRNGFNWTGLSAQFAGSAAALLFLNTPIFTGPLANALGGLDLSIPAGMLVAAMVYAVTFQRGRVGMRATALPQQS